MPAPTSHAVNHENRHRCPFRSRLCAAFVPFAFLLPGGCDVRDEEAQDGSVSPWPPRVVERLATPSQRSPDSPSAPRTIDFIDGYAAGSRRAAEAGLPMVLVFRASWCRWSETFVAKMPSEPHLVGLAGRFVCVSIDADRDQATCRSFGVQAFPTAIVLDRERRETYRASGASAREGLVVAVESVLDDPARRVAGRPATTPR
jgi:hypothetical protein